MFKKFIMVFAVISCLFCFNTVVFAQDTVETTQIEENVIGEPIEPMELYQYGWIITDSYVSGTKNDKPWREGPSGTGPGTVILNNESTWDRTFITTITGEYTIGKGAIGAALGFEVGESYTYGTSYEAEVAAGERKTIYFRPKYRVHTVISEYVKISNATGQIVDSLDTETAEVEEFVSWDYKAELD